MTRQNNQIALEALQKLNAVQAEHIEALKGGSGGGTSGGDMHARIARLESDMDHVKKSLEKLDGGVSDIRKTLTDFRVEMIKGVGDINTTVGTLKERSTHLPTRWEAFLTVSAIVAVIGTIIAIAARLIPPAG